MLRAELGPKNALGRTTANCAESPPGLNGLELQRLLGKGCPRSLVQTLRSQRLQELDDRLLIRLAQLLKAPGDIARLALVTEDGFEESERAAIVH